MLDGFHKDKTLPNARADILMRRMSTVGKKSVQTISNEERAQRSLGICIFPLFTYVVPSFYYKCNFQFYVTVQPDDFNIFSEIFVWIGYVSSGVNPLVYTLFNKTSGCIWPVPHLQLPSPHISKNSLENAPVISTFWNPIAENSIFFMNMECEMALILPCTRAQ